MYWALWESKREWIGATVHYIDEGIDTGPVLAYVPIETRYPGERFPSLYVRATKLGVERLIDALYRLAQGERWTIYPPQGEHVYRSEFSGWRLVLLEARLALRRCAAGTTAVCHKGNHCSPSMPLCAAHLPFTGSIFAGAVSVWLRSVGNSHPSRGNGGKLGVERGSRRDRRTERCGFPRDRERSGGQSLGHVGSSLPTLRHSPYSWSTNYR
jgi:hypothetical protein